jgi:PAS domain S-box-containing protein
MLWILVALLAGGCALLGAALLRARRRTAAAASQFHDHLARAPLAVIEWGPEWRIVRWEGEAERIFGYTASETVGRRLDELALVHPDDAAAVTRVGEQLTAGRDRIVISKNRNVTRDGRTIHCEWYNSVALDGSGRVASMLSFVVDVTAQRNAEEQLRRTQRLEEIGRLAGGVAHETNNQMSVVLGFASQVSKAANLSAEQQADLEEVRRAAERVATVTRQLLAFSRQQVLRPEPVDLGAEVREASALLGRLLGPDLALVVNAATEPLWICADRTQITQLLVNCAVNARHAMPGGGTLTLTTSAAPSMPRGRLGTAFGDAPIALLSIRDTGLGIAPEVAERIFDPFFTTKPLGEGTGLGLSVVEGIVAQSRGDVWLETEPGRGTCFTFGFPIAGAPRAPADPTPASAGSAGSGMVLVVDDEPGVRAMLVRVLAQAGYTPLEAPDGVAALALLRSHAGAVRAVVSDQAMPNMDGAALAEHLRIEWPGLPIVIVSGHAVQMVTRGGGAIAAARFLQKPFPPERLLDVLADLLGECALRPQQSSVS